MVEISAKRSINMGGGRVRSEMGSTTYGVSQTLKEMSIGRDWETSSDRGGGLERARGFQNLPGGQTRHH